VEVPNAGQERNQAEQEQPPPAQMSPAGVRIKGEKEKRNPEAHHRRAGEERQQRARQ
jgi:hypothetical protein